MPLRLSTNKWLKNDQWNQTVLHKYGKHLHDTYGIEVLNDDDHTDLEKRLSWNFNDDDAANTNTMDIYSTSDSDETVKDDKAILEP